MKKNDLKAIWGMIIASLMFSMGAVSAYPYQLNLTDGSLIDLNQSDNSTNITIYIIHIWQNSTQNITVINQTCYNCTYNYINQTANYTTQSNVTYIDYKSYNRTEIDDKINSVDAAIRSLLPGYSAKSDIDSLSTKITNLENKKQPTSNTFWLWVVIGIIGLIIIYLGYIVLWGQS